MAFPNLDTTFKAKQVVAKVNDQADHADVVTFDLRGGKKAPVFTEVPTTGDATIRILEHRLQGGDGPSESFRQRGVIFTEFQSLVWNLVIRFDGVTWDPANIRRYTAARNWIEDFPTSDDEIQTPIVLEAEGYLFFLLASDRLSENSTVYEGIFAFRPPSE